MNFTFLKLFFLSGLFLSCTHGKFRVSQQPPPRQVASVPLQSPFLSEAQKPPSRPQKISRYKKKKKPFAQKKNKKSKDAFSVSSSKTAVEVGFEPKDEDFSIEENSSPLIEKWIHYFKTRGREYMATYLGRSSRYLPMMKRELKARGLPQDLAYVAMIESGFSPQARSYANAVGYWQFIEGTAKRYGLKVNSYVDERRDPVLATRAAARYLKDLYGIFGSWNLALASYNAGEYRVSRAVLRHYTRNFWYLSDKKSFPRETTNYVPKFIAAVRISKNPAKYGFEDIVWQKPFEYDTFTLTQSVSLKKLAQKINVAYEDLRKLNPGYRGEYVPVSEPVVIRIPTGQVEQVSAVIAECSMNKPRYAHFDYYWYRVRRGDTLYRLARRNKTTISTIRRMNKMTSRTVLRAGRKIKLPEYNRVVRKRKRVLASSHVVRPGENLSAIARKYRVKVKQIKLLNGLKNLVIHPGQVLHLVEKATSVATPGQFHVVQKGDTLIGIARQYKVSLPLLMKLNSLNFKSVLMVGTRLSIPSL